MFNKIGIIGLGLIGGSIAKKTRKVYPEICIKAMNDRNKAAIKQAIEDGVVNEEGNTIEDFSDCDLIILCAPVKTNIVYLEKLKDICKEECIITDVGSVKGDIHKEVIKLGMEEVFVGGHPMAGSEKSGYEAAKDYLLENAYYIVTKTANSDNKKVELMEKFAKSLGAIPLILDATEHDKCVAVISHVPHIVAYSLVKLLKDNDLMDETMKKIAAGGFKDITRIASSSPKMWENICMSNSEAINNYLDIFEGYISEIKNAIKKDNSEVLFNTFTESKNYRDSINSNFRGAINKSYDLYVDILDETGAIATIATILARKSISILNIAIIHNRDFEEGVLKITFHDEEALEQAKKILVACDYIIHEKK
ncbi:MAG: prephenate dehydrogenase [Lachnospiraceae bacterium]|nr:prephenate dehydrogenase [Lachnospiraceae bacterium]